MTDHGEMMRKVKAYGEIIEIPDYRIFWLSRIVYSSPFELCIAFVILLNAISLGLLTMSGISDGARNSFEAFDRIALYIYTAELVLRMISYGKKPWEFFRRGWNIFDFLIVALSPIFAGQTVILRLLRLLRLIRIFRFLPEVKVLTISIVRSIPPLLSMSVLIFLALFIYGMAGVYLLGEKLPVHWGDISIALTTLFILLTLENFPVYLEEAILVSPLALPFFLSYIFIVVFTVLNVFIGIVLNAMDEARSENRERMEKLKQLDAIVHEVDDITADGKVTEEEIAHLREKLKALERLAAEKPSH
jgi:voltage-gated sodium channel